MRQPQGTHTDCAAPLGCRVAKRLLAMATVNSQ